MSYYNDQQRINIFLNEKFKDLELGIIRKLDIHTLVMDQTTQHPISKKYVLGRINDLLKIHHKIREKDGVLVRDE